MGAAATAWAAGDGAAYEELMARAEALDRERPSCYGCAMVALGRAMLRSDALGACP